MKLTCIGDVLAVFEQHGDRLYGEDVTQREHALQAATHAAADGASRSLIAAALLHDFGHLVEPEGDSRPDSDARHEAVGAALLNRVFVPDVTGPIALHVAAKRYLCATEPAYFEDLSEASRHSLSLQGGPFSTDEAAHFAARPHFAAAVRLRRYDDFAKVVGASTPDLASFVPMLSRLTR